MADSSDENELNPSGAPERWIHDVPGFPHRLVNEPLQLLVAFYKEHIRRDIDSGRLKPPKCWIACRGILAAGEQTYAAICILLTEKRAKRLMLQANVLNRSLFELVVNVVALTEDPDRFAMLMRESWKLNALRYRRYASRFGAVPKWQEYLAVYARNLSASAPFFEVTPEEQNDPNLIPDAWPTPGVMIFGRRQTPPLLSGSRLAAMRELYQEHYAGQSAQAHGRGVSSAMALFVDSPEGHWNPGQGESNIVSIALLMMACMISELETAGKYERHAKLAELWTYLCDMHDEAKELWDIRYQHMVD